VDNCGAEVFSCCSDLVDLDVAEDADEVHHGGVELEAQVGRDRRGSRC